MTAVKGVFIPADEATPIQLVELDQADYKQIQKYVGGTFAVLDTFRPDASIWLNDEGKIHGLPLNRRGTLVLWAHRSEYRGRDALCGDVLLLGPADEETGNTLPVPDELVQLFFHTDVYRYLVKTIGEEGWHGNGRTFDNWVDAYNNALALAERWTLVEHVKVAAAS